MRTTLLPSLLLAALSAVPTSINAQVDDENSNGNCSQFVEAIPFGSENNAALIANNDIDFFRVEVPASGVLNAYVNAVLNAAFEVQVWDAGCNQIVAATGNTSATANVYALVCGGTYFVRVSRQSGTAPIAYTVGTSWDPECGSECNNTMATATPIAALDTTFQTRLWGSHAGIAANTDFNIAQDQDFYRLQTGATGGVLNILGTNIPGSITLRASLYEGTPDLYQHIYSFQRESCNTGNLSGAWILEANKTYYLRLYDETFELTTCGGAYNLDPNCFQISLTFESGSDPCGAGEANNTMATAQSIPLNHDFQTKLWGYNERLTLNTDFNRSEDQDFFKLETTSCGGVLNILGTNIPNAITLRASLYEGTADLYRHIHSFQRESCNTGNLSGAWILEANKTYYLRLYDETFELTTCGGAYNLDPSCFHISLGFESGCDPCGAGEANNTMATSTPIELNTTFETKLWGFNEQLTANTPFDRSEDQDFYSILPEVCGSLGIHATNIPNDITLRATVFGPDSMAIASFQRSACNSGDLTGNLNIIAGTNYFIRLYDETFELSTCGGAYNMDPGCFLVTFSLTPAQPPQPTITADGPTAICPGSSVTLTSSVATGNIWSNGATTQSIVVSTAGIYTVTTYDGQGCPATSLPVTITTLPATTAGFTATVISGGEVSFSNTSSQANTYLWTFGDGSSSATPTPTHTYAENGEYEVTLIAVGACGQDTLTQTVTITSVGMQEHVVKGFTLYPNPTSGHVVIEVANGVAASELHLFDATGRMVMQRSIAQGSSTLVIDLAGHESGLYVVHVVYADGMRATERLVKE